MPYPPEVKAAMVRMFRDTGRTVAVAEAFGCALGTVANVLREHGIARPSVGQMKRRYTLDEGFFADIDTEEKAWLLGFITTDGNITVRRSPGRNSAALQIRLAAGDREILERISAILGSNRPLTVVQIPERRIHKNARATPATTAVHLVVDSLRLAADLIRHGIVPNKTAVCRPWAGPAHLMRHYWRGCVDGDGSLHSRDSGFHNHQWQISFCGTEAMARGFAEFVGTAVMSTAAPRPRSGGLWAVVYGGTWTPQRVAALLYGGASIALARKQALADQLIRSAFVDAHRMPHRPHRTWKGVPRIIKVD